MRTQVQTWCGFVAGLFAATVLTLPAYADGVSVAVQRVDVSQFPTMRAYVSVANSSGAPITGLDAKAFQLQEDGKPIQEIAVDPTVEGQDPMVTALVIDVSETMAEGHKLDSAKEAAMAYVDALGPTDRGTIVSFGARVTVVQEYTTDKNALKSAIDSLAARGNKVLYDAIAQTARRQGPQNEHRKPMILLTDGPDASSAEPAEAGILAAASGGSPVYTVGIGAAVNRDALIQIAGGTGGRSVFVTDPGDLKPTLLAISDQLRRQYVLRYTSKLTPDSKPHGLAIQATYLGQSATGLNSFTLPTPTVVTVTPPTPLAPVTAAPTQPTSVPTAAPQAAPTPVPAAASPTFPIGIDSSLLLALVLILILVVACAWYLSPGRNAPAPLPTKPDRAPPKTQTRTRDVTEAVSGGGPAAGLVTSIRPGREKAPPQVRLAIVCDGKPSEFSSRDARITLGRADGKVSVVVDDPLVSSEHALIRRDGAQFYLEDLGSTNGTQLNGESIVPRTPRLLKNQDRIYLGDTVVTFVVDSR